MRRNLQPKQFRTEEAEWRHIRTFAQKLEHAGELFNPPAHWYSQLPSNEYLDDVARQLSQWLGIKPRQLDIQFSSTLGEASGQYIEDTDGHHIVISTEYAQRTYQVVAIIAHELVHYLVESRWDIDFTEELQLEKYIDLVTIYAGFGPIILNGLNRQESWIQRLQDKLLPGLHLLKLGYYSPQEYADHLGSFVATSQKLTSNDLYRELAPWSRHYFGRDRHQSFQPALHIAQAKKRIRNANFVLASTIVAAIAVGSFTVLIIKQIPPHPSVTLLSKKEQADTLYENYLLCAETVANRQAGLPKADLLTQQSIASDRERCLSLRNQYNAAIADYNQALHK